MSDKSIEHLKTTIAALWQMENELRYSAWNALALDKQKAQEHLSKARGHLNALLNIEEPLNFTPAPPPVIDDPSDG